MAVRLRPSGLVPRLHDHGFLHRHYSSPPRRSSSGQGDTRARRKVGAARRSLAGSPQAGNRVNDSPLFLYMFKILKRIIPVLTETFKDSFLPRSGISAKISAFFKIDAESPETSFPKINAVGPFIFTFL